MLPLVQDLSFDLARGETLAIAGESGSGKSITALAIMGLLPGAVRVASGTVHLGKTDLTRAPEDQLRAIRGDQIAMIFQEPMTSLNPIMTVGTQLTEAIRAHEPMSRAQARAAALKALQQVRLSQPERRLTQFPHELSGGMRQRVMIAMALALRPQVLIADEPTTALDVTVQREVLDLLRDLQNDLGTAIILITHDMGVVAEMADRVIVMRNGRMVEAAPVADLFAAPAADYTRTLLAAVPRIGQRGDSAPVTPDPIARITDLRVGFDIRGGILQRVTQRLHAVAGVSFAINKGETLALVGESGCGKSTIARAMVGLVPHQGQIEIGGQTLTNPSRATQLDVSRKVQMVFQDPMAALDPRQKVADLLAEPLIIHGMPTSRSHSAALLEKVGLLPEHLDRYPHEFSGGQRQRLCIARALVLNPALIVADEAVSALDVSVQARVLDLLRALKAEYGIALLFISHDMAVVESIADRVAVMCLGQIVELGTRSQVFGNPQHAYTRRLLDAVLVPDPSHQRNPTPRLTGEVPSPVYTLGKVPAALIFRDAGAGHLVAVG